MGAVYSASNLLRNLQSMEINKYIQKIYKNKKESIPLFDGPILRLHYRWTFLIMLVGFLTVSQQWAKAIFSKDIPKSEVKEDLINFLGISMKLFFHFQNDVHKEYLILFILIFCISLFVEIAFNMARGLCKTFGTFISVKDYKTDDICKLLYERNDISTELKFSFLRKSVHSKAYSSFIFQYFELKFGHTVVICYLKTIFPPRFFLFGFRIHSVTGLNIPLEFS
ncbi:unnamed protein product, partial [Meganyctiphanes norvegica]